MKLKIATWNISGGVSKEVEEDTYFDQDKSEKIDSSFLKKIIEVINYQNIDIICFQEIITTKKVEYINSICDNTNLKNYDIFELSECNLVENSMCGIAILSKFPIIETEKVLFTNPKLSKKTSSGNTYFTYDKGVMNCKIDVNGNIINVITHHGFPFRRFNSTPERNIKVFNELGRFIDKYDNRIITGDFNVENPKLLINEINSLIELNNGITTIDGMKFDKIYIDKRFKYNNFEIIKECSDHYMLSVVVEFDV